MMSKFLMVCREYILPSFSIALPIFLAILITWERKKWLTISIAFLCIVIGICNAIISNIELKRIKSSFEELNKYASKEATSVLYEHLLIEWDAAQKQNWRWKNVKLFSELMLAIDPNCQYALSFRGEYERNKNKDYPSAIDWYTKSLKINNSNKYAGDTYLWRASCYKKLGEFNLALEDAKKAKLWNPKNAEELIKEIEQEIKKIKKNLDQR